MAVLYPTLVHRVILKEGVEKFKAHARTVKRYGAAVVIMAFDEEGQAATTADKIRICKRCLNKVYCNAACEKYHHDLHVYECKLHHGYAQAYDPELQDHKKLILSHEALQKAHNTVNEKQDKLQADCEGLQSELLKITDL